MVSRCQDSRGGINITLLLDEKPRIFILLGFSELYFLSLFLLRPASLYLTSLAVEGYSVM
jgi:hypothetical protein